MFLNVECKTANIRDESKYPKLNPTYQSLLYLTFPLNYLLCLAAVSTCYIHKPLICGVFSLAAIIYGPMVFKFNENARIPKKQCWLSCSFKVPFRVHFFHALNSHVRHLVRLLVSYSFCHTFAMLTQNTRQMCT